MIEPPFPSDLQIVSPKKQLEADFMHEKGFREREGFPDQPSQSLPQGEIESLDVVGPSALLPCCLMLLFGDHLQVDGIEVGEDLSSSVLLGVGLPKPSACGLIPIPYGIANHLQGGAAYSQPDPEGVGLPGHKAPQ